jgi:uracil-DNA glycosylase
MVMNLQAMSAAGHEAMSMNLDARQRAMLAEMGVRLWAAACTEPVPAAPAPTSAAVPAARARQATIRRHDRRAPRKSGKPRRRTRPTVSPPAGAKHVVPRARRSTGQRRAVRPCPPASTPWTGPPCKPTRWPPASACGLCAGPHAGGVRHRQTRTADWMVVGEAPGETGGPSWASPSSARPDSCWTTCWQGHRPVAPGRYNYRINSCQRKSRKRQRIQNRLRGVYIANVIKCRPPGNRNPAARTRWRSASTTCARQVALVQPRIILAHGALCRAVAAGQTAEPIGKPARAACITTRACRSSSATTRPTCCAPCPTRPRPGQDLCLALDVAERGG